MFLRSDDPVSCAPEFWGPFSGWMGDSLSLPAIGHVGCAWIICCYRQVAHSSWVDRVGSENCGYSGVCVHVCVCLSV